MNHSLLLAAMWAALPVFASAQEGASAGAPGPAANSAPSGSPCGADAPDQALGALPARASTRPQPQLGTVAPATWLPRETHSASSRAMAVATARQAGQEKVKADGGAVQDRPACAVTDQPSTPQGSIRQG
ncbi:hypothetical protein [Massilia sp. Se16.2.3]|uniref:hypothetical protein n=1 Tax=Massilia sp. Se16.2.3 TaxID=2709303 RepID=UPI0016012F8E|nr:hypothetical protein [Massilia sp. Se16.2.3]QNB01178.1 hypothetical protein G4G31_24075 [Massilia sp. Se16.2.3]